MIRIVINLTKELDVNTIVGTLFEPTDEIYITHPLIRNNIRSKIINEIPESNVMYFYCDIYRSDIQIGHLNYFKTGDYEGEAYCSPIIMNTLPLLMIDLKDNMWPHKSQVTENHYQWLSNLFENSKKMPACRIWLGSENYNGKDISEASYYPVFYNSSQTFIDVMSDLYISKPNINENDKLEYVNEIKSPKINEFIVEGFIKHVKENLLYHVLVNPGLTFSPWSFACKMGWYDGSMNKKNNNKGNDYSSLYDAFWKYYQQHDY